MILIVGVVGCGTQLPTDTTPTGTSTGTQAGTQAGTQEITSTPTNTQTTTNNFTKQSYLDAINNVRAIARSCGSYGNYNSAPALRWNDALYNASMEHSQDMAQTNTFEHTGSNTQSDLTAQALSLGRGSTLRDRVDYNNYLNWSNIGENIAAGNSTTEDTIAQWISSDGHCANMMNPKFTEVGMSHAINSNARYRDYWTQTFGARF